MLKSTRNAFSYCFFICSVLNRTTRFAVLCPSEYSLMESHCHRRCCHCGMEDPPLLAKTTTQTITRVPWPLCCVSIRAKHTRVDVNVKSGKERQCRNVPWYLDVFMRLLWPFTILFPSQPKSSAHISRWLLLHTGEAHPRAVPVGMAQLVERCGFESRSHLFSTFVVEWLSWVPSVRTSDSIAVYRVAQENWPTREIATCVPDPRVVRYTVERENREFKKKISFILSKSCIVDEFGYCSSALLEWLTFCQNLLTCYYFLQKKNWISVFWIPLFSGIAVERSLVASSLSGVHCLHGGYWAW